MGTLLAATEAAGDAAGARSPYRLEPVFARLGPTAGPGSFVTGRSPYSPPNIAPPFRGKPGSALGTWSRAPGALHHPGAAPSEPSRAWSGTVHVVLEYNLSLLYPVLPGFIVLDYGPQPGLQSFVCFCEKKCRMCGTAHGRCATVAAMSTKVPVPGMRTCTCPGACVAARDMPVPWRAAQPAGARDQWCAGLVRGAKSLKS